MSEVHKIYEKFLQHCAPYRLRGPWKNITLDADCRACSPWGTAVLAELAEKFGERELVASGIAQELADGLVMNPALVSEPNSVVALRLSPHDPPYALLTASGVLVPAEGPLRAMMILQDHRTQDLLSKRDGRLHVVFTIEAAILLRGLGFLVTLIDDFVPNTIDRFEELQSACHWGNPSVCNIERELRPSVPEPWSSEATEQLPAANFAEAARQDVPLASAEDVNVSAGVEADPSPDHSSTAEVAAPSREDLEPVDVVLVAWSPVELSLDQPREFPAVASHLLQMAEYLRVDIPRIAVWRPTLEDLGRINFCLRFGSVAGAVRVVEESADASVFVLDDARQQDNEDEPAALGYKEARRELEVHLRARPDS